MTKFGKVTQMVEKSYDSRGSVAPTFQAGEALASPNFWDPQSTPKRFNLKRPHLAR